MLYLSRGEQALLVVLVILLLGGAGLFTYRRGLEAGGGRGQAPLFVEAPPAAPIRDLAPVESAPGQAPTSRAISETKVSSAEPKEASPRPSRKPAPNRTISLNAATVEDLVSLPGIGPVYARRIVDHREQLRRQTGHGFTSVDELLDVRGIGAKRLARLRPYVVP